MGRRGKGKQSGLWVAACEISRGPAHPFYRALNRILDERGFDRLVEQRCREFYAERVGRPSLAPGVYFRLLLIGYFEGIESERGIAWRVADSLALREFLGYELSEQPADHSTISRTRRLISLEVHREVFQWALEAIAADGLLKGKSLGVDGTTLEANAALRSIVRRDTGESYEQFLKSLAKAAGIETPTRAQLARLDRKRAGKGSNEVWQSPSDPDARITKMKDGRTHFAYRVDHVTDLESSAIVAVIPSPADQSDTASIERSVEEAQKALIGVIESGEAGKKLARRPCSEIVADKGFHSGAVLMLHEEAKIRTYISEPRRGARRWVGKPDEKRATYANRRRIRGERGKELLRLRGEKLERSFAHAYDTGGLRRLHVRGLLNIEKRIAIGAAAFDLALILRKRIGVGKPRQLQGRELKRLLALLRAQLHRKAVRLGGPCRPHDPIAIILVATYLVADLPAAPRSPDRKFTSATGC